MSVLLLALLLSSDVSATEALKAREAEVRKLMPAAGQPIGPHQRRELEQALTQIVDLDQMAQRTLGDEAAKLSGRKKKEFLDAFVTRFARASGEQLDAFRSHAIRYLAEEPGDEGTVKVPTEATVNDEPTDVVYLMREDKRGWKIEDVVIDGVSTVDNFRRSFSRVIAKEGIDGLIARLKKDPGPAPK